MPQLCIIFDLDGTLVDSEKLCNQAFVDLLPELTESVESLTEFNRGKKLATILTDIEVRLGHVLPADFEAIYRERVADLFKHHLEPTPGTPEMLEALSHPRCVASSGPSGKIAHALRLSGLAEYFGNNTFSSYEVGSWKPEPGLFLHAAKSMGFHPVQCVVVEDSEVGLVAAQAAGMRALHYAPAHPAPHPSSFRHMRELPALIESIANAA